MRLRTNQTKGSGSRTAGLAMAFILLEAAQARWRCVNAPHLVALVRAGATFVDGPLSRAKTRSTPAIASPWRSGSCARNGCRLPSKQPNVGTLNENEAALPKECRLPAWADAGRETKPLQRRGNCLQDCLKETEGHGTSPFCPEPAGEVEDEGVFRVRYPTSRRLAAGWLELNRT